MTPVNLILLVLSVSFETIKNIFNNNFSKNNLKNQTDIYKFGFFTYIASFVVLLFFKSDGCSLYTVVLAVFFAALLALNQYFFIKALSTGPLGFTNFIQGISLLIPTFFGIIFWNEKISHTQIIFLVVLVLSLFWALNIKVEKNNIKWWLFSILTMLTIGFIGVVQSLHQMSDAKSELMAFLKIAFLLTTVFYFVMWTYYERKEKSGFSIKSVAVVQSSLSGAFMGGVHIINLYLSGAMPKVVFFPVSNGGLILLNLILSVLLFREKINYKQWIGMIVGIVSLCFIGM